MNTFFCLIEIDEKNKTDRLWTEQWWDEAGGKEALDQKEGDFKEKRVK